MLSFFTDSGLRRPISIFNPKLFCIPDEGGTRSTTLFLGDPYTSTVQVAAAIGAATLYLADTSEFLSAGTVTIGGSVISYTGVTSNALTGVTGITAAIAVGSVVTPNIAYVFPASILIAVSGGDATSFDAQLAVCLKQPVQSVFGFPGTPSILSSNILLPSAPVMVDVQVTAPAGADQLFTNVSILCSGSVKRQSTDLSAVLSTETKTTTTAQVNVYRHNQGLTQHARLLPISRQVSPDLPGFLVGQSRWRDNTSTNAVAMVPTRWNVDVGAIGDSAFISGIANTDDLSPVDVESSENSLFLRVQDGFYFTGPNRFFLPAGHMLEFLNADSTMENGISPATTISYSLLQSPRAQTTVFVGTWTLDQNNFFQKSTEFRYAPSVSSPVSFPEVGGYVGQCVYLAKSSTGFPVGFYRWTGTAWGLSNPTSALNFALDRTAANLIISQPLPPITVFLGITSGQAVDYFDLPTYPVANVSQVYAQQIAPLPKLYASAYVFDKADGTIQVTAISGATVGLPVYAVCSPAVAVLYEQAGVWKPLTNYALDAVVNLNGMIYRVTSPGTSGGLLPDFDSAIDATTSDGSPGIPPVQWTCQGAIGTRRLPVDLNPAYSGIASGFVYLLHSRIKPQFLTLAVDKPQIPVPPVGSNPIGLIAYGPVYAKGDYALLVATAYDGQQNPIPNVQLQVVPGPGFAGSINYQDPTTETILVRTGGDGTAKLVYTPNSNFGSYLPITLPATGPSGAAPGGVSTTTVTNDTLNLSAPTTLSQFWNSTQGWLTTLYAITDDIGVYGKVGANVDEGEIPYLTQGTPGAPSYKTNGRLIAWLSGSSPVQPINGYDASGQAALIWSGSSWILNPSCSGMISKLVYAEALPTPLNLSGYFFSYSDYVSLSLEVVDSNITSNPVMLEIEPPATVFDSPWLILDNAINGILDTFRLGATADDIITTPIIPLVG